MPEVSVLIGGRVFEVACQEGQEEHLKAAAAKLDAETHHLGDQLNRISESKMLLMAGLVLADRGLDSQKSSGELEKSLLNAQKEITRLNAELAQARSEGNSQDLEEAYVKTLENIAEKMEALAK